MKSFIRFTVPGLPPRKKGSASVWRQSAEVPRLKLLRAAAHEALKGRAPISENCEIHVLIFAGPNDGDLDSFITGILDGLQKAHHRSYIDLSDWMDVSVGVLPSQPVLFSGARWVDKLTAERLPPGDQGKRYYIEVFLF